MVKSEDDHVRLFAHLRPRLRQDLTVLAGIPNPIAGSILNWFDPANPEYLDRVDAWQKLLCANRAVAYPPFIHALHGVDEERDELVLDAISVRAIHQVAKLVYKWHGEPAKKTDWQVVASRLSDPLPHRLKDNEVAGIRECLSGIVPVDLNEAVGRFGPGATAEAFDARGKWHRRGYIPDVPPALYRSSPRDSWSPIGTSFFRCTRANEVPKSIKSNRIVSSEPAMSMFAQLAVNDHIVDQIHHQFVGHVSLNCQEKHNRLLHLDGMATLDLSDASDHLSAQLVESVLPQLWPVLAKVRSEYIDLPTIGAVRLQTFAPMGSGVCFSVMTTVILGIIAYAFRSLGFRWRREPWSVYGDDIIVPIWIADYVMDLLERAGFVINVSKSCTAGNYVESCGLELYHGCDVTPVYLKDPLLTLEASKVELIASKWCELFPNTLKQIIEESNPVKGFRYNKDLQAQEILVRSRAARSKLSILDGYAGLNRWFCVGTLQSVLSRENGFRTLPSGVAYEVWTKIAWRYKPAINYPHLAQWFATMR